MDDRCGIRAVLGSRAVLQPGDSEPGIHDAVGESGGSDDHAVPSGCASSAVQQHRGGRRLYEVQRIRQATEPRLEANREGSVRREHFGCARETAGKSRDSREGNGSGGEASEET